MVLLLISIAWPLCLLHSPTNYHSLRTVGSPDPPQGTLLQRSRSTPSEILGVLSVSIEKRTTSACASCSGVHIAHFHARTVRNMCWIDLHRTPKHRIRMTFQFMRRDPGQHFKSTPSSLDHSSNQLFPARALPCALNLRFGLLVIQKPPTLKPGASTFRYT